MKFDTQMLKLEENRKLNEDINNVVKLRMILDPLLSKVIKP